MTCPICNGATNILDSRLEIDCVNRRRECQECGYRFNTVEIDKDLYERIAGIYKPKKSKPKPEPKRPRGRPPKGTKQ